MLLHPEMCLYTNRSCYSACIRVLPLYPFDLPYFSSQPSKVTICARHVMASVPDIKTAETLLMLCLACSCMEERHLAECRSWIKIKNQIKIYAMKRVQHSWNWGVMAFTYWDVGHTFHEYYNILCIFRNGWMDCRDAFHAVLCLCC